MHTILEAKKGDLPSETRRESDFVARKYWTLSQRENLRSYVWKGKDEAMRKPGKKPEMKELVGVVHTQS